jgi:hypothetical protein
MSTRGTVTPGKGETFHSSLQGDESLTQQGIFQYRFCFAAGEIPGHAYSQGIGAVVRAGLLVQALFGPAAE